MLFLCLLYFLLLLVLLVAIPTGANASVGFKDGGANQIAVADLDCYPAEACSVSGSVGTIDTRLSVKNVELIAEPSATTGTVNT